MRPLVLAFIALSIVRQLPAATAQWKSGDGRWAERAKWSGAQPAVTIPVEVNGKAHVTLAGMDAAVSRLDVGTNAASDARVTMNGGSLCAAEFIRLGEVAGSRGNFVLDGGNLCTTEIAVGGMNQRETTQPACAAALEVRGGQLVTKYLALGWLPDSHATFHVVGSRAEGIAVLQHMDCAILSGNDGGVSELAFDLDAGGVTPINLHHPRNGVRLSRPDSPRRCQLCVNLLEAPPGGEITLVRALSPCQGTFAALPEGSIVRADYAGHTYEWRLTYRGGEKQCDIALIPPQTTGPSVRPHLLDSATITAAWEKLFHHIDAMAPPLENGPLAFPGAEGFGAHAKGGRGGRAIFVTNLNDAGPGSLRAAIDAKGPRTVIFRVGGTIELKTALQIREPFITIAGQTALGDGICLRGAPDTLTLLNTHDVIVRGLRVRTGFSGTGERHEGDCISCYSAENFIIDHCSASWGTDETISCTQSCDRYTVQWCILAEGLEYYGHSMASIAGGDRGTWHHNLFAHCRTRNPRFAGFCRADFRNNVIYNWGDAAAYGDFRSVNYADNFLKPGPSLKSQPPRFFTGESAVPPGAFFADGNVMEGFATITRDNRTGTTLDVLAFATKPHDFPVIKTQPARDAAALVFASAGATCPKRDPVDLRIVTETREGRGHLVRYETEVGGHPAYFSGEAPRDADGDGIPDAWETAHQLNPSDSTDAGTTGPDGFTLLEVYLNHLFPPPHSN